MSEAKVEYLCRNSLGDLVEVDDVLNALATPDHPELPVVSQLLLNDFKSLEYVKRIQSYAYNSDGQITPLSLRAWYELPGQIVRSYGNTGWYKWYCNRWAMCEPLYMSGHDLARLCSLETAKHRYYSVL